MTTLNDRLDEIVNLIKEKENVSDDEARVYRTFKRKLRVSLGQTLNMSKEGVDPIRFIAMVMSDVKQLNDRILELEKELEDKNQPIKAYVIGSDVKTSNSLYLVEVARSQRPIHA